MTVTLLVQIVSNFAFSCNYSYNDYLDLANCTGLNAHHSSFYTTLSLFLDFEFWSSISIYPQVFPHSICLMSQVEQWPPKEVYTLTTETWASVTLHGKKGFADVLKVKGLEMQRAFWVIQVGTIPSHKSLKVEILSWLQIEMADEEDATCIAGFEEGGERS